MANSRLVALITASQATGRVRADLDPHEAPRVLVKIVNSHDLITALRETISMPGRRMLDALVDAYLTDSLRKI